MITFIETSLFTSLVSEYLTDDEYREMQNYLIVRPDAGNLIQGSGGIRKLRWARTGMGKSSGVRTLYYWAKSQEEIYLLTMYNKNEQENIDSATLKRITKELEIMK
jgi:hypothetical protein